MFKIGNTHFIGWLWNELMLCKAWVSNLWASDGKGLWPIRNWAAQHEVSLNVMHLNHPETIPIPYPQSGKIVFHKTGPWYQKCWGPLV